ncbi:MAG: hypothetical protein ACI837_001442 [Crocinitomicaceae bacterium]|jgi:hypothetical protein
MNNVMKKIYTLSSALVLAAVINAQTIVDFESFTLPGAETFDNGSAELGDWDFNGVTFTNVYDTAWGGSWTGFSLSNMTDDTTAGYFNQYSSYTASGYGGSANYAVYYNFGEINTNDEFVKIDSFKITNGTYAAVSMRDGDMFAKQFGSVNDASGSPDGTNGEDFFKVWIYGEDFTGTQIDSIEFFLADYTFVDSNDDYILDTWENIDLTGFSFDVAKLDFKFESSDKIPGGGYWTPTYFVLDNLVTSWLIGIDEEAIANVMAYPNPMNDVLNINGSEGVLTLTDATGKIIIQQNHHDQSTIDVSVLSNGIFFISLVNENGKFTQKLIK